MNQGRVARRHRHTRDRNLSQWLMVEHVSALLEQYRANVVLDVGSNRGQYAHRLRRSGYRGWIVSFEPVPSVFAKLQAASQRDKRWRVAPVALGEHDGEADIHVAPGNLSSLLEPSDYGRSRYTKLRTLETQRIQVRRLEGLLPEVLPPAVEPRIFLKLDTQGYDLQVFAGLGAWQERLVGLQSEVALLRIYDGMPRLPEALATYENAGYEVSGLYPVSREASTARVLEYDCVMVRAAALHE